MLPEVLAQTILTLAKPDASLLARINWHDISSSQYISIFYLLSPRTVWFDYFDFQMPWCLEWSGFVSRSQVLMYHRHRFYVSLGLVAFLLLSHFLQNTGLVYKCLRRDSRSLQEQLTYSFGQNASPKSSWLGTWEVTTTSREWQQSRWETSKSLSKIRLKNPTEFTFLANRILKRRYFNSKSMAEMEKDGQYTCVVWD